LPRLSADWSCIERIDLFPCHTGRRFRPTRHALGRAELLTTSFATFEEKIREQLGRMLGPGGFDPARDVAAITVNRWPHGYAYEYNPLFDPDWQKGEAPHEISRARFGPIAIANSDAAAYTGAAIDQAQRAVEELLGDR
jgi:spermidine dehydrogenase